LNRVFDFKKPTNYEGLEFAIKCMSGRHEIYIIDYKNRFGHFIEIDYLNNKISNVIKFDDMSKLSKDLTYTYDIYKKNPDVYYILHRDLSSVIRYEKRFFGSDKFKGRWQKCRKISEKKIDNAIIMFEQHKVDKEIEKENEEKRKAEYLVKCISSDSITNCPSTASRFSPSATFSQKASPWPYSDETH